MMENEIHSLILFLFQALGISIGVIILYAFMAIMAYLGGGRRKK